MSSNDQKMSRPVDQFAFDMMQRYGLPRPEFVPENWVRYCSMKWQNPFYSMLAGNIEMWTIRQNCSKKFSEVKYHNLSTELMLIIFNNKEKIDEQIKEKRDFKHDIFSVKTLCRSYLIKNPKGEIIETIQYLWMRVALGVWGNNLTEAFHTYNLLSDHYFTFATPTLFNSGTQNPQMSSCFLLAMKSDSIKGIFDTVSDCAQISKYAGGIGLHIHNIRASGSHIKGTNGTSNGIVPMLQVFNHTARYVDQGGGKRKGSFAIYMSPWHLDIEEFLELKLNIGDDNLRTRDLFTGLWVSDLFMKRVKNEKPGEKNWTLFCPSETNCLNELVGEDFEEQFQLFEKNTEIRSKNISSKKIWGKILKSQVETGTPYILFKDACNKKSNQKNLGTIKSSNLCTEIIQYSDENETAVCNLASIVLPRFLKESGFDFKELQKVVRHVVRSMNKIIDANKYPTGEAWTSNMKNRPLGLGVQGLNDVLQNLELEYGSEDAMEFDSLIFETIYYAAVSESIRLAKQDGAYRTFPGSPASEGKLQFDFWKDTKTHYDWDILKVAMKQHGLRNSLLIAQMPTASTSQICGSTEEVAIPTTNLYSRQTLAGKFLQVNKNMVFKLMMRKMWNEKMQQDILNNRGSVQNIENFPEDLKPIFRTIWETKQKNVIDHARARAPWICQSQSTSLYFEDGDGKKLSSALFYSWKLGLKTGSYYIRV